MGSNQTAANALAIINQIEQEKGNIAELTKELVNLLRQSQYEAFLPPLLVGIESELDDYPREQSRHLYHPDYLKALDEKTSDYMQNHREDILKACARIKECLS